MLQQLVALRDQPVRPPVPPSLHEGERVIPQIYEPDQRLLSPAAPHLRGLRVLRDLQAGVEANARDVRPDIREQGHHVLPRPVTQGVSRPQVEQYVGDVLESKVVAFGVTEFLETPEHVALDQSDVDEVRYYHLFPGEYMEPERPLEVR